MSALGTIKTEDEFVATYTEHEQRQLDAASGAEMDKRASTELAARSAQSEAGQMLSQIAALVVNPDIPDSRLDRLFALQKELIADQRRMAFSDALARASANFGEVKRSGRMVVYSKEHRKYADEHDGKYPPNAKPIQDTPYAKFEDVVAAVVPALSSEGLHVSYEPEEKILSLTNEQGIKVDSLVFVVTGIMTHSGGFEKRVPTPSLPIDTSGSKNPIQARKSTVSYGRKMALELLTGVSSRDEDDDGASSGDPINESSETDVISDEQYAVLQAEITRQGGKTLAAVLTAFGLEDKSLADLPAAKFEECKQRLRERAAAAQKGGTR